LRPDYFVDTSVWISYFRGVQSDCGDLIDALIDENRVHINGIVLAELLTGARSQVELDRLAAALAGLRFIPGDRASIESAGRSAFLLKRKGISLPLSDVIIAADCIRNALVLIESDKHFAVIAAHLPLKRHVAGPG
jgi:predicted nucleic acid-binding protein